MSVVICRWRLIAVTSVVAGALLALPVYADAARPEKVSRHARAAQVESIEMAFARCMRANGANQPDPTIQPGHSEPQLDIVDSGANVATARAACDPILKQIAAGKAAAMGAAGVAVAREEAQQFVGCMSAHGVTLGQPEAPLYDVGSLLDEAERELSKASAPAFQAARVACAALLP